MHGRTNLTAMRLMDACEHLLCEAETFEDLTARRIAIDDPDIVIARMVEVIAPMFRR